MSCDKFERGFFLREDRHDCCMSMDFLQVLIHQHAKTIVALQELQSEVTTLKDFRNSVLSSLPELKQNIPPGPNSALVNTSKGGTSVASTTGTTGSAVASTVVGGSTTTSTGTCLTVGVGDVWTSPKLIDSGFSTETNKSSPTNKSDDEDPLYSLLDLIQLKVSSTSNQQAHHHCCSTCSNCCDNGQGSKYVPNGKRLSSEQSPQQLGRLDHLLQFRPSDEMEDCSQVTISRNIIGAVLREVDVVELQRQVLFGIARVKSLEAKLVNLQSTTSESRLASKYLALSQENEQLRFKLKEQEIQLEGTKARLRILERLKEATAVAASSPSGPTISTTPNSIGNTTVNYAEVSPAGTQSTVPPEPAPRKSRNVPSSPSTLQRQASYIIENYNDNSEEEFYPAEVVPVRLESTAVNNNNKNMINNSINNNLSVMRSTNGNYNKDSSVIPEDCDVNNRRSTSSSPSHALSSSWGKSHQNYNNGKPPLPDKVFLNNLGNTTGTGSRQLSAANQRPSRIPVTTSRPGTPGKKLPPPTPPKSLSSISSKSSIPIAVTRLKRSQSSSSRNGSTTSSSKNKMGQFWAQWFG
ncbi:unnamed protein product [Allacma fusca]|uniref:Uncharacterized protein n=1 Tax=Allacma fusca TaxID=39272 RepID=A0A8J2PPE3_9HEXA|nr:unnamed protein product [Allacma fusca]